MTVPQSKKFFTAAISGTAFNMSTDSMSFHLSWSSPWPLPTQSLLTDKATFVVSPSPGRSSAGGKHVKRAPHIESGGLVLIREPSDFSSVLMEKFGTFVGLIDEVIVNTVPEIKPASLPQGCGICVQFRLPSTNTSPFKLAMTSSVANSILPVNAILDALEKLPCINVFAIPDIIEVQLLYACWGFQIDQFGPPTAL